VGPDAIAIFGGGYAVSVLRLLPWLRERDLAYWHQITHGRHFQSDSRVPMARCGHPGIRL